MLVLNDPREELIPIRVTSDQLPLQQGGRPVHPSTIARWALYGLGSVKLASIKIAGRRDVRRVDLQEFLERCADR